MAGFAYPRPYAALALVCACAMLPLTTAAKPQAATSKHRNDAPLHFDPPAAGPAQAGNAAHPGYDACIEQPSPDGAAIDCQALAAQAPAKAKAQPKRHR